MAKSYGLWQGLKQLKDKGFDGAMVVGDSRLIIQAMSGASQCRNLRLARMLKIISFVSKTFRRLDFFHILHELNDMADLGANKSMVLGIMNYL